MAEPHRELEVGRKNIEQRLIGDCREAGIQLEAENFFWNRNQDEGGLSEATTLEVKFRDRTANAVLSRKQIEHSSERVDRPDVLALIRHCVAALAKSRT